MLRSLNGMKAESPKPRATDDAKAPECSDKRICENLLFCFAPATRRLKSTVTLIFFSFAMVR